MAAAAPVLARRRSSFALGPRRNGCTGFVSAIGISTRTTDPHPPSYGRTSTRTRPALRGPDHVLALQLLFRERHDLLRGVWGYDDDAVVRDDDEVPITDGDIAAGDLAAVLDDIDATECVGAVDPRAERREADPADPVAIARILLLEWRRSRVPCALSRWSPAPTR